jgi:hypothetical protein
VRGLIFIFIFIHLQGFKFGGVIRLVISEVYDGRRQNIGPSVLEPVVIYLIVLGAAESWRENKVIIYDTNCAVDKRNWKKESLVVKYSFVIYLKTGL